MRKNKRTAQKSSLMIKFLNVLIVVMLLAARPDTRWWHEWVAGKATEVRFVKGRLKFGGSESGAPFPSAVVVYDKRPRPWWIVRG